ncbi:binding-protein-dependent transport systems inner membrane component [Ignisphaera aggregans DSM 17230]|uniref:Binding-protein-dependent transport systems inner membrane component n=1 Tax=Ignisphaera aggregans (strain DSM 17230 / JCM 13409 / AQ1.S1) TaxID=583356 RepID=E0SSX0_IGNAA|nr:binding-protein-dependent transport systems inner membrane component [Ignisphaera aggregans DSM 17230]
MKYSDPKKILFPIKIALILVLPSIVMYVFFNIWPMIFSIGLAFTDANRYNVAPSPEKIASIKNAIACAELLRTSSEHRGRVQTIVNITTSDLNIISKALLNMSRIIAAGDIQNNVTLLRQYIKTAREATTNLSNILIKFSKVFNCTELGYQTDLDIIPRDMLDRMDSLYSIIGQLYTYSIISFRGVSTEELSRQVYTGLNISSYLLGYFSMLQIDYEGYIDKFIDSANSRLNELTLKFVGLDNFVKLFKDPRFYNSLFKTLAFTAVSVPMKVFAGLLLALFYSTPMIYGRRVLRAILLIPWATPFLMSALAWKFLFLPNGQLGMLFHLNINAFEWDAFIVYCLFEMWLAYPFIMTITQGALTGVSKEVIEASYIDGASLWLRLKKIMFPLISRPLMVATILTTGASLQAFMIPLLLNGGGPVGPITIPYIGTSVGYKNEMLILLGYYKVMIDNEWGYAASLYLVILLIILTYVSIWFIATSRSQR